MLNNPSQKNNFLKAAQLAFAFLPIGLLVSIFEFSLPIKLEEMNTEVLGIGLFITASWLFTTLLDFFWGSLNDRVGERRTILVGVLLLTSFIFGFTFFDSIWTLLFLNVVAYIGYDLFYIALEGMLIKQSVKKDFSYSTSGFFPVWQIGFIIGPLLAAYLITTYGFGGVYILALPLGIASLFLFYSLFGKKHKKIISSSPQETHAKNISDLAYFKNLFKSEYLVLIGIFMCAFWYTTMSVGIPLLYVIEDNNIWASALTATAFAIPFLFTDLADGFLATNKRRRFLIIMLGFLLGGVSLISFSLTHSLIAGMLAAFFSTVGVNFAWATFEIEAGLISEKSNGSKVQSVFVFCKNLGWDISPAVFGVSSYFLGLRAPFAVTGIMLIVLSIIFFYRHTQIK